MKYKLLAILYIFCLNVKAQQVNYGFSSRQLLWNPHTSVASFSNFVVFNQHIFYIGLNGKICEYYWNGSTWIGGGQLEWGSIYVKSGSKLVSNGNGEIYFIGSLDNKIYKLSWSSGLGWNTSLLLSNQEQVRGDANLIFSGNHIFYIGSSNKICDLYFNGVSWSGGGPLIVSQPTLARSSSEIIASGNHLFYIGSNNKVCECLWNGATWTGGSQLESSGILVKTGTQITNNGGNELFFVGNSDSKIYDLKYSTSWNVAIACSSAPLVRSGTNLVYYHEAIYYVSNSGSSLNKVVSINRVVTSWAIGSLPNMISEDVANYSQLCITSKNIYKEGSSTITFESTQISYVSSYSNKISYLILDYDPINDPNELSSPIWFAGRLNTTSNTVGTNKLILSPDNGKSFFYIGVNGYLNTFGRNFLNAVTKPGWILTLDQEFDIPDHDLTILKNDWNYKNGPLISNAYNPNEPKVSFDTYFENTIVNNGILELINKQENYNAWQWGEYDLTNVPPFNSWYWWNYESSGYSFQGTTPVIATSANIQTGKQNPRGEPGFSTHAFTPPAPPYESATFTQSYGYYEIRCKTPRSQKTWSAFWLLSTVTNPPEIDILEIGGNGKYWVMSNYYGPYGSGQQVNIKEYAIGYRYYDDYYTYALEWDATKIRWLHNNEPTLTLTTNVPSDPIAVITGTATYNNVDLNEITVLPNSFNIDYIRVYQDDPTRLPINNEQKNISDVKNVTYEVFPNPSTNTINLKGGSFSKIEIINLHGKKILESYTREINISELQNGIYFIKVFDNTNVTTLKFIKN